MTAIAAIHTLKARAGLDDASYRDLLDGLTGKRSSRDLTDAEAARVRARLQEMVGSDAGPRKGAGPRADRASGPYAKKLQALWLALYDLGVVRDRRDSAMMAMVERQTGLSHVRFLLDPADMSRAVEALKGMATRAGVVWPTTAEARRLRCSEAVASRHAIVQAQVAILTQAGQPAHHEFVDLTRAHAAAQLLTLQVAFGYSLRKLPARQRPAEVDVQPVEAGA